MVHPGGRPGAPAGGSEHSSVGLSRSGRQLERRSLPVLPGWLPAVLGGDEEEGSRDGSGL